MYRGGGSCSCAWRDRGEKMPMWKWIALILAVYCWMFAAFKAQGDDDDGQRGKNRRAGQKKSRFAGGRNDSEKREI